MSAVKVALHPAVGAALADLSVARSKVRQAAVDAIRAGELTVAEVATYIAGDLDGGRVPNGVTSVERWLEMYP